MGFRFLFNLVENIGF